MSKRGVIRCLLSIALGIYLVFALIYTSNQAAADSYSKLSISIAQSESSGFVTADDIDMELGFLSRKINTLRVDSINTLAIERRIQALDNIESANCAALNNGTLLLEVVPLQPIARVFDITQGSNYYINRQGKKMKANARYRIDVPVVTGRFSEKVKPESVIPLIDYLEVHPQWANLISSIKVTPKGDILAIPMIRGHVINFGDCNDLDNKFARLTAFYHQALPAKGWEYYDTISVKWKGQVVGSIHKRSAAPVPVLEDLEDYIDDPGTMMTETDNPPQ